MKIQLGKQIGTVTQAQVKEWKRNPSDFTAACQAAAVYVRKNGARMVVIPGNSYGVKVFHVVPESESLSKYTAMPGAFAVAIVDLESRVFMAVAE